MPFLIRPHRRFPVQCAVAYNAGPVLKLPLASCLGFGSLITLLVLSSGPAYAEWVDVGASDSGNRLMKSIRDPNDNALSNQIFHASRACSR